MPNGFPSIEELLKQNNAKTTQAISDTQKSTNDKPSVGKTEEEMSSEEKLERKMEKMEISSKEKEAAEIASVIGVSYINLVGFAISPDALRLIPEERARELKTICFLYTGPELRIGSITPEDEKIKNIVFELGERYKTHAVLYKITDDSFNHAVELYKALPKIREIVKGVQIKQDEIEAFQQKMGNFDDIEEILKSANITDVLSIVIAAALKLSSSDIHIEAEEQGIAVRLRVDGILQDIATLQKEQWKKIINRIKLIAGLKLNITDKPQDGRFTIYQKNQKIDVRTSSLPTAWGESVVMRILNPESIELAFEQLGLRKAAQEKLVREIEKPHGMIITTGPTGSGKTTTLYAILQRLNKPGVKIITLEDPIEYKLKGINQSQIDQSKEYTFAKGLRSILRQDPDIVLVGEIRDLETADTAIQASLTGHLLLSTIHTNDAAGAIPRFTAMGVKPFLLAPSLNAIMGQRLIRRVCEKCKTEDNPDTATLAKIKELLDAIPQNSGEEKPDTANLKFYKGTGCEACNGTGYKGRVGVYEILVKNAEIESVILSGEISEYKMREVAAAQGMVSMAQDGLLKALEGITTLDEVSRVIGI
jgi:type IV pilus assembly protein PilB